MSELLPPKQIKRMLSKAKRQIEIIGNSNRIEFSRPTGIEGELSLQLGGGAFCMSALSALARLKIPPMASQLVGDNDSAANLLYDYLGLLREDPTGVALLEAFARDFNLSKSPGMIEEQGYYLAGKYMQGVNIVCCSFADLVDIVRRKR